MATDALKLLDKAIRLYCPGAIEMFVEEAKMNSDWGRVFTDVFDHYLDAVIKRPHLTPMMEICFTWQFSKVVYRFDDALAQELLTQDIKAIPADALNHMPQYCICIADPPEPGVKLLYATSCLRDNHMTIFWLYDNKTANNSTLQLRQGATIEECYNAFTAMAQEAAIRETGHAPEGHPITKEEKGRIERALKLILYLCADNAEVKMERIEAPKAALPRDTTVHTVPKRPTYYDVGTRIGSVIRKTKAEAANAQAGTRSVSGAPRRSPIPHVRSAHYATYWTGEGRKIPVVHWIEPIFVGYRDTDELPTTVRQVKK